MTRYVALLRGINVGGIRIKMADLAKAFAALGLQNVKTVLASGNVVFSTKGKSAKALKRTLDDGLSKTFGYEAYVVLVSLEDVQRIVDAYPFDEDDVAVQPYVMFASDAKSLVELAELAPQLDPALERIRLAEDVLYWEVRRGASTDSSFAKESSKARYKAKVTTRNMRTLRKVLAAG